MRAMDSPEGAPRAWKLFGSEKPAHMLLFQPRWDLMENPRTGERMQRLVLETRDWVNVVAQTADERFVFVRQYRFGTRHITTEIPGGVIDGDEAPRDAAARELREETGYTSTDWTSLGAVEPNPAFHDNRCHHFLARDVVRTHEQELDAGEDIQIVTLTRDEVVAGIRSGEINHALVLTALCRLLDLRHEPETTA